ncbi:family 17 glycosyl hydrolase [Rhizodiscina lignyota]|uniref:glucan 1,3-beta-glucosidase n=1 Tax=Rhizodiscina lignyota TaxID=1504668 RepID=A0A9P4M6G5_9PEZI|nr:family 17 glycosyl hydrolase [Rhizodiscina lignyota]
MRFFTTISFALAASPALGSAVGNLGFALGTKNSDGSCKAQQDYEDDFDAIAAASGSKLVRGYAASDCNCAQYILPAAKAKGAKVILGVWPDTDESFDLDKQALQNYATKFTDQVYAVTVGSETLYRGNFTAAELLDKMDEVRSILPNTKIGTADSWNKYADGTADDMIKGKPDILLVNAFGYWQAQPIDNATHTYFDDMMQAFTHIQSVAGSTSSIELWNGETGWPTDGGTDYGAAKAGTANAKTYWQQAVCPMIDWGFNVFYFEAMDEPWKPDSVGDNGSAQDEKHWGAMTAARAVKFSLKC